MENEFQRIGNLVDINFSSEPGVNLKSAFIFCQEYHWNNEESGVLITNVKHLYFLSFVHHWHCCEGCLCPHNIATPLIHSNWKVILTFDYFEIFDIYAHPTLPVFPCKE